MASGRTLTVLMNGRQFGTLSASASGAPALTYDDWLADDDTAIGLSMAFPPVVRTWNGARLANWLQGLLPDRNEVLDRWRREFGVARQDAFSLLWHVGEDVAGAAQFVRPDRLEEVSGDDGKLNLLHDDDVADRLRALVLDRAAWAPAANLGQFSLAGGQAKFALAWTGNEWADPTGNHPTTHIFKPAMAAQADQDINEHLSMRTAARLGLAVPATQVRHFGGQRVLVVERFDRIATANGWLRVHQEDMCQAAGHSPMARYESQGGPGIKQISELISEAVRPPDLEVDLIEFVRAVAFNWLSLGTDAHAKNYALLHAPGQSRLAPLYDLNSYLPYGAADAVTLSMRIGTYHWKPTQVTARDWAVVARQCGLNRDRVLEEVESMALAIPEAAANATAEPDVAAFGSDLPGRFVDAIADHASACLIRIRNGRPNLDAVP